MFDVFLFGTQDGQDALKMAAASINEETHRETQQTRTETQEKQRKSFISDRAEWSEARPPLTQRPQGPCYKPRAQMHIHPHTLDARDDVAFRSKEITNNDLHLHNSNAPILH